jgi:hypothetical protein
MFSPLGSTTIQSTPQIIGKYYAPGLHRQGEKRQGAVMSWGERSCSTAMAPKNDDGSCAHAKPDTCHVNCKYYTWDNVTAPDSEKRPPKIWKVHKPKGGPPTKFVKLVRKGRGTWQTKHFDGVEHIVGFIRNSSGQETEFGKAYRLDTVPS